jgi:hypothetical protein
MDRIAIEQAIVVEPINQTLRHFVFSDCLHGQFASAITPLDGLTEPARLPVIEW